MLSRELSNYMFTKMRQYCCRVFKDVSISLYSKGSKYTQLLAFNYIWVILLNLVHTGYLQFLTIFHNLASNEHDFFGKN